MSDSISTLTVATDEELQDRTYRTKLQWSVFRAGIGQRDWLTVIQDDMRRTDELGVHLQYAPVPFEIPLVDDVFPHDRYIREFMNDTVGVSLEADRLIDLHFRIRRHHMEHFGL